MQFYDDFCEHCDCPEEVAWQEKGERPGCHWLILATALNQQPPAWVVKNGMPTCLAFRRRGKRD